MAFNRNHGWHMVIHDRNEDALEVEPDGHSMRFMSHEFLNDVQRVDFYHEEPYDYFHFSIDCSSFTVLGHPGQFRNAENDFLGQHDSCKVGNQMVNKMLDMIGDQLDRNEKFLFTIENPYTGKLKEHPMIKARLMASRKDGGFGATPVVVDYCWFADANGEKPFKKRTIFWTNSPCLIRFLGPHEPPLRKSHFLCEHDSPCMYYRQGHRQVAGNCKEATPFPRQLADLIARCISLDASKQRLRKL